MHERVKRQHVHRTAAVTVVGNGSQSDKRVRVDYVPPTWPLPGGDREPSPKESQPQELARIALIIFGTKNSGRSLGVVVRIISELAHYSHCLISDPVLSTHPRSWWRWFSPRPDRSPGLRPTPLASHGCSGSRPLQVSSTRGRSPQSDLLLLVSEIARASAAQEGLWRVRGEGCCKSRLRVPPGGGFPPERFSLRRARVCRVGVSCRRCGHSTRHRTHPYTCSVHTGHTPVTSHTHTALRLRAVERCADDFPREGHHYCTQQHDLYLCCWCGRARASAHHAHRIGKRTTPGTTGTGTGTGSAVRIDGAHCGTRPANDCTSWGGLASRW